MSGGPIDVSSTAVLALFGTLRERISDLSPMLKLLGEDQTEEIKGRFATATGPDGARWAPNTRATLEKYIMSRGGFSKKTGKILAKGQQLAINKRPLQGLTGDLARQIFYRVYEGADSVLMIGSNMRYAAMHQYGGSKAQFPNLWGDIPARPYFPVTPSGELYPQTEQRVVELLQQYLTI